MRKRSVRIASLAFAALLAAALHAQSLDVYPEFRRPDPFGGIVAADRGLAQREVLSPAVARNGFASFHIVVSVPPQETYFLYVVPNPVTACRVALYKEHFVKTAAGWIPDTLTEVTHLPDFGAMPDPDDAIEGQNTRAYLLDLWLPPNADVARFRLEVQLKVADWIVRPMEVRVLAARYPDLAQGPAAKPLKLSPVEKSAADSAFAVAREYFAHAKLPSMPSPLTVRAIIQRNAIQDMAMATFLDPSLASPEVLERRTTTLLWNNFRMSPPLWGAEWYLRLRDYLFNSASR